MNKLRYWITGVLCFYAVVCMAGPILDGQTQNATESELTSLQNQINTSNGTNTVQTAAIAAGAVTNNTQTTGIANNVTAIGLGATTNTTQTTGIADNLTAIGLGADTNTTQNSTLGTHTTQIGNANTTNNTQTTGIADNLTAIGLGADTNTTQTTGIAANLASVNTLKRWSFPVNDPVPSNAVQNFVRSGVTYVGTTITNFNGWMLTGTSIVDIVIWDSITNAPDNYTNLVTGIIVKEEYTNRALNIAVAIGAQVGFSTTNLTGPIMQYLCLDGLDD